MAIEISSLSENIQLVYSKVEAGHKTNCRHYDTFMQECSGNNKVYSREEREMSAALSHCSRAASFR